MTLEEAIAKTKQEILQDIENGVIPPSVKSYSALHDYVDANCYAGACEPDCPNCPENVGFWNTVQDAVDEWLKARRPKYGPIGVCVGQIITVEHRWQRTDGLVEVIKYHAKITEVTPFRVDYERIDTISEENALRAGSDGGGFSKIVDPKVLKQIGITL
jgi:hypothetical protein